MDLSQLIKMAQDPKIRSLVTSLIGQFTAKNGTQSSGSPNMAGLINTLDKSGMGDQVKSWVGTGDNQPCSADQVTKVFGADTINKAATDAGMSPTQAANDIAKVLPALVDTATPSGKVPSATASPDIETLMKQLMGGNK